MKLYEEEEADGKYTMEEKEKLNMSMQSMNARIVPDTPQFHSPVITARSDQMSI
jgi:hypothetical protein